MQIKHKHDIEISGGKFSVDDIVGIMEHLNAPRESLYFVANDHKSFKLAWEEIDELHSV